MRFRNDLRLTVQGPAEVIEVLEAEICDRQDVHLRELKPHDSRLESTPLEIIVLAVSSGAGAATIRSIAIALIRKNKIKITVKTDTGEVEYEGPLQDVAKLAQLAESIKIPEPPPGGGELTPPSPIIGEPEPTLPNSRDEPLPGSDR